MDKLTTERLEEMRDHYLGMVNKDVGNALTKLLAYEQAAKNPVGKFVFEPSGERWHHIKHGEHQRSEPKFKLVKLFSAPVLPKQPELPQGFTYESGILTANFGNGDVLISDTHWPESGHAGISFAPVPQPKRPNFSDYTDLLGGSKTEDVGTLFIVKSNSAESLIAIRNKLDIAINALSPAPAQPVIPDEINSAPDYVKALTKEGAYIYGWNECRAAAQPVSEPYKLPSGWKLVPIEPTAAMFHAFNDCDYGRKSMRERYIQMIEAAPAQESE